MENKTDLISWRRPAYVNDEDVQSLILDVRHFSRGMQSACLSLVEIRGTPKYLTGSTPCWKPS
jgi:hypothetical protein